MHDRMNLLSAARLGPIVCVLALAGCTRLIYAPRTPSTPSASSRYEVVPGRESDVVARLRAAPPPAQLELSDGKIRDGDERLLRAQGTVRIGTGYFPARNVNDAREQALQQGRRVGADKILIYPPLPNDSAANVADVSTLTANYYVRLRLPFGANFRDLTPQERQTLGADGVEIGEVIGGTPAAEANLRSGDFVLKLERKPVRDKPAFQALLQAHLGRRVILTIRRDGVTLDRLVRLGVLPAEAGH